MTTPQDSRALMQAARQQVWDHNPPPDSTVLALCDALEQAFDDRDEAIAILREVEWARYDAEEGSDFCPLCYGPQPRYKKPRYATVGHDGTCRLAAYLGRHPQQAKEAPLAPASSAAPTRPSRMVPAAPAVISMPLGAGSILTPWPLPRPPTGTLL